MAALCDCPGRGHCPRYGRLVTQREYELCSATCPPERPCPAAAVLEQYRDVWAGKLPPPELDSARAPARERPCRHLGGPTGERRTCRTCAGHVDIKLRACALYGQCTTHKVLEGVACCQICPDYSPPPAARG